ncbi:hypothetical protein J7376_12115 [Paracoccus sp. R12_1]|uniref:hypothetical protein n=1 Tax=unclassified Paracoccus (in: a-proteobacteria) TaxID=2688777 RepID=UPI001ADC5D08|nr:MULTISPECIES: hypothetical protein [unclassified Paracoccus (in: a-proteobacteria)]MBO9454639.1 hypothetical protein [Paracoccus sp. R12_2]MBO9487270.1 hypothetical protein [Paracoccus sp. R12_1]
MDKIDEFFDDRNRAWCIHCSGVLANMVTTEDHVPTQSFLRKPRPHHLPKVTTCFDCNNGFSKDEQYVGAFLSCVVSGTIDPDKQFNASAASALRKSPALRSMIDQSKTERLTETGEAQIVWMPDRDRVNRVVVKNARGHSFFELGEPMMNDPDIVWTYPIGLLTPEQRAEFEGENEVGGLSVFPEVGSKMMTRIMTGQDLDGSWVIVQDGIYRYEVNFDVGVRVRTVIFDYLATEVFWN